ncbi:MAG: zf-HC2 domain-containing protein [Phycisphaerae bacterium]
MNCSEAERLFDAYLDGELSGALRLELDAHRLRCRRCQQTLAMLEACEHVLSAKTRAPALAADFTERVMARVAIAQPRKTISLRRWIWAGSSVMSAAATIVLAMLWTGAPSRTPADPLGDALDRAFRDRDKIALMDIIYDKRDQLLAARGNLASDLGSLARYVGASFSYPDDVSRVMSRNPITGVIEMMVAPTTEKPVAAPDSHSL